jgi:tRNA(Arg) A34 adenosine deaminase TadA
MNKSDKIFLQTTVDLSRDFAEQGGGFPVAAMIVKDDRILAQGVSDGKRHDDPTWHAETDAIRKACAKLRTRHLDGATLYSSMEPCLMCYGATYWAGIDRVVFAAGKEKLDKMHYDGVANSVDVNNLVRRNRPLKLIRGAEFEKTALKIVRDWEKRNG